MISSVRKLNKATWILLEMNLTIRNNNIRHFLLLFSSNCFNGYIVQKLAFTNNRPNLEILLHRPYHCCLQATFKDLSLHTFPEEVIMTNIG